MNRIKRRSAVKQKSHPFAKGLVITLFCLGMLLLGFFGAEFLRDAWFWLFG